MQIRVNIRDLLDIYDADRAVRPHSAAIKSVGGEELGIALAVEYFRRTGHAATVLEARCSIAGGGNWLDAWIATSNGGGTIHYQTEVKAWSFHGYNGGPPLAVDASDEELAQFKRQTFARYWDGAAGRFRFPALDKALKKAIPQHDGEIRPLACLWAPMHPAGHDEPLFPLDPNRDDSPFPRLWIFSASSFLRQYRRDEKTDYIDLDLPVTGARLGYLERIYTPSPDKPNAPMETP